MLTGRKQIFTNESIVTGENVVKVLNDALPVHLANRSDIEYLHDVLTGNQIIRDRIKPVREEINNKIVINHANQFVAFKTASLFGIPLQYVSRGSNPKTPAMIERLNSFMISEGKSSKDVKNGHWAFAVGVAYAIVLKDKSEDFMKNDEYDEAPFEIYTLDPHNTFVIRVNDVTQKVVAAVTYVFISDSEVIYTVYTPNITYKITGNGKTAGKIKETITHNFGMIPIVEFKADPSRIGTFELVLDILDAINTVQSNRVDGIEQFIQALMVFENADIDSEKFMELKDLGALKISSSRELPAKVYYLIEQLDQMQTQTLIDCMYQQAISVCGIPAQSNSGASDSSNNGSTIIKSGVLDASSRLKLSIQLWKESEIELLKIVLKICREANAFDLKISEIDPKFGVFGYEDKLTKAQTFTSFIAAGAPSIQAFTYSEIAADPESASIVYDAHQAKAKEYALQEAQRLSREQALNINETRKVEQNSQRSEDK